MEPPDLTAENVVSLVTGVENVGTSVKGGQKQVFPCKLAGVDYVLKFMTVGDDVENNSSNQSGSQVSNLNSTNSKDGESGNGVITDLEEAEAESEEEVDEVTGRARRELEIMQKVSSPYLVKPGPLPLTSISFNRKKLIYFSEEFINGTDLRTLIGSKGKLSAEEICKLGIQINEAIKALWSFAKIHRDIKPANIMQRQDGNFVLLDLGLAFDLLDDSLTRNGFIVGTPPYFSPEQLNFASKRQLDFRSDLFSLGIVLFEAATGQHPFAVGATNTHQLVANIASRNPQNLESLVPEFPKPLSVVIQRLLNKQPHLRFRSCDLLTAELEKVQESMRGAAKK